MAFRAVYGGPSSLFLVKVSCFRNCATCAALLSCASMRVFTSRLSMYSTTVAHSSSLQIMLTLSGLTLKWMLCFPFTCLRVTCSKNCGTKNDWVSEFFVFVGQICEALLSQLPFGLLFSHLSYFEVFSDPGRRKPNILAGSVLHCHELPELAGYAVLNDSKLSSSRKMSPAAVKSTRLQGTGHLGSCAPSGTSPSPFLEQDRGKESCFPNLSHMASICPFEL